MRWNNKPCPKDGEVRLKTKFLFFPLTINNKSRWLEFSTIKQTFYRRKNMYDQSRWINNEFKNL